MDRSLFIEQCLDFGSPDADAQERSVKAAERGIGMNISAVAEGSREQDWAANIAKRHYLTWLAQRFAIEHNFGNAALQQKFQNHLELLKFLKEEWAEMAKEMKSAVTKPENFFQSVSPNFCYDQVGRDV